MTATQNQPRRRRHVPKAVGVVGLGVWFLVMLSIGTTLLARHAVALPRPSVDEPLARAMATLRGPDGAGRWMAVHVLYTECQCSQRIVAHLLASDRPRDVAERVVLVGRNADLEQRLASRGFHVLPSTTAELADRYHVVAVPLLVVVAPDGTVRYAGGYTNRKQGPDPRDLEILAETGADRRPTPLPLLGCAVSDRLRASLNPLNLP